ncbi:MAG: AtpZ/AtpI family protein [Gemmobacter sp.]|uniref:AtpZ/AtpI family protein n=1 Tax=Gemmobacter sp. TaxID=1898957 RepID=UPI00391D655A
MADDPDPGRIDALERRIAAMKAGEKRTPTAMKGLGQGEAAWRMVIELVVGMGLGLAIGFGLDVLFGTKPVMMVIFVLLGLAAGIRTMLRTAAELGKQAEASSAGEKRD